MRVGFVRWRGRRFVAMMEKFGISVSVYGLLTALVLDVALCVVGEISVLYSLLTKLRGRLVRWLVRCNTRYWLLRVRRIPFVAYSCRHPHLVENNLHCYTSKTLLFPSPSPFPTPLVVTYAYRKERLKKRSCGHLVVLLYSLQAVFVCVEHSLVEFCHAVSASMGA